MSALACCFWWFLFGLLLGWLLNWLVSRWIREDVITPVAQSVAMPVQRAVVGGIDLGAAAMAGFVLKGADDLQIIEGIGPKIAGLLKAAGINTFAKLAATTPADISPILEAAGPRFKLANPGTWPRQAKLCTDNRWAELKALQDELDGGVDMHADDVNPNEPKS